MRLWKRVILVAAISDLGGHFEKCVWPTLFFVKAEMGVTGVGNGSIEYRYLV